ncbi:MAG: hypothetical protein WB471_11585 [Nocardioides sp.]
MSAEWSVPAWAVLATLGAVVVLAVVVLLSLAAVRRAARRAQESAAAAHALNSDLLAQVGAIERQMTPRAATEEHDPAAEREYVITRLGEESEGLDRDAGVPPVDGPLFADLLLRESVVQAASFAAGLRRALAPAHLNRVRFEMRREIKRARKQRRADLRQARREYEARERDLVRSEEVAA